MGESSSNKGGRVSYFGPRTGPSPHTRTTKTPAQLNPTSPNARRPGAKPTQTPKPQFSPPEHQNSVQPHFPHGEHGVRHLPVGTGSPPTSTFCHPVKCPPHHENPSPPAVVESPYPTKHQLTSSRPLGQPRTPSKSPR